MNPYPAFAFAQVLQRISPRDRVVLLDERGIDMTSEGLAHLIAQAGDDSAASLTFLIGGPFGHGPAARDRADVVVRLSAMVLNHQVARLVLLEQLYRAW